MRATLRVDDRDFTVELAQPVSLATPITFDTAAPTHFGAPPPSAQPLVVGAFAGAVSAGASCNCSTLAITPHCHGTHTECVAHLTLEALDAWRVVPAGLVPALLITVTPRAAAATSESTTPAPSPGDRLVCRADLVAAWPADLPFAPRALIVRTGRDQGQAVAASTMSGSAPADDATRAAGTPPYLSREAAELLVERGIEHLVVELPSLDRDDDEGRLTAHRIYFGLPAGSTSIAAATRPAVTVTELAHVPDAARDGACMLQIQVPAIAGDAVPSRPLLYPLLGPLLEPALRPQPDAAAAAAPGGGA